MKTWRQELVLALVVAAAMALLQILVEFDPSEIKDWRLWAISLASSCIRSASQAALTVIARRAAVARE